MAMIPHQIPKSLSHFLWHFVSKQPLAFFVFLISPIAVVLKTNVISYALKLTIDTLSDGSVDKNLIFGALKPAMWIGGGAWLGLILVERFDYIIQSKAVPKFEANMRMDVIRYALSHSYEFFNNQLAGNIVNKFMVLIRATDEIRKIITLNIIPAASIIIASLILMYTVKPVFALIIFAWVVSQLTAIFCLVGYINQASMENAEHKSNISGLIMDTISNIASVKLFARETYELAYIQKQQEIEKLSNAQMIRTTNWFCASVDFFATLVMASTFYLLIKGWKEDQVTVGDFAFVFYIIFIIMNRMWQLGYAFAGFFREIGVAQESLAIIAQKPNIIDRVGATPLKAKRGKIEFKDVTFYYREESPLFEKLNIVIEPGQKVGVVGYSGGGKSSFVNLMLRFYDVKSGIILIDEQDISQVQQSSLRENISVMLQDTNLFHRSLFDNISYGNINATELEVIAAAKHAHCDNFIKTMPEGYKTFVGERGTKLSGGQRQRISIARIILKKSPIIILDEATSALDSHTENFIQKSLEDLTKMKTVIVIAHRLSTLAKMDRILVFDKGKIVEDGKHTNLLKASGMYAGMWNRQMNGFLPS